MSLRGLFVVDFPSVRPISGRITITHLEKGKVGFVDGGGREMLQCVLQGHDDA